MGNFSPADFNAVVQTVAGEAANQPPEAQRAVASTVLNRHSILGGNVADIASDPNVYNGAKTANAKAAAFGTPLYKTISENIAPVFTAGPTTSATHFHANMDKPPSWDNGSGTKIGDQVFLDRSDLLKGSAPRAPGPTPEELEAHFSTTPTGTPPAPVPVDVKPLPPPQGYIEDPQHPGSVIKLGGPSADELEAHFGGAKPGAPLTPSQKAAQADANQFESTLDAAGRMLLSDGLHFGGAAPADLTAPALHGLTQGWSDEAKGKLAAGVTGAKNFVLNAMGQPIPYSAHEAETAYTQAARDRLAGISKAHPIASTVAETAGAAAPWVVGGEILAPAKAAIEAPTALGRVAQYAGNIAKGAGVGSVAGAAGGALSGLGNAQGDLGERLPGAAEGAAGGAVIGGALGGALPAVAPAAAKIGSALWNEASAAAGAVRQGAENAFGALRGKPAETTAAEYMAKNSPAVAHVKGMLTPPDAAESVIPTDHETRLAQERVRQLMAAKGMHVDDLRAIPEDIPHTTAEAIGSTGVNHAASLARRGGTTPDAAGALVAQRNENFASGVMDDFASAANVDPRQARVLNEDVTGVIHKDDVTPAYKAALDVEHAKPVMTPALAKLQEDPDVAKAIEDAKRFVAKSGRPVAMPGPKINPDTGAPVIDPTTQQPVMTMHPTAEVWDMAKKFVDTGIVKRNGVPVTDGPDGVKNVFLTQAAKDLRGALVDAVPGYDKALASASDELGRKTAYRLGSKNLFGNQPLQDFKADRAKLSPDALEAHTAGVANALFDAAQNGRLTPGKLKTPLFQAKVREIMGDRADAFLDRLTQRTRLQATGQRIAPGAGSQSTPLLHANDETGPVLDALGNVAKEAAHLKLNPAGFVAKHIAKAGIGDRAADIVETPGYRNAYGRLLLQHPRETADELRQAPAVSPRLPPPASLPVGAITPAITAEPSRQNQ